MFPETIETDRLRLERFQRGTIDSLELYERAGRGETIEEETEYLSWSPHENPEASAEFLDHVEEQWDEREAATYAIFPREGEPRAGEFAGNAGLHLSWDVNAAGLGIWLRKPFWGRGYSGERAGALLALAFDRLDLEVVSVAHLPENEKSKRAIEKYVDRFGGRYEGHLRNKLKDADGEVHDVQRYSISQEEWAEATAEEPFEVEFSE